jgi:dTDP-4-amino-4,6-dideoxygalactose transaminase
MKALQDNNIACAVYYPIPLHRQEVYLETYKGIDLPVSQSVASKCFSLPVYPELENEKIDAITDIIKGAL